MHYIECLYHPPYYIPKSWKTVLVFDHIQLKDIFIYKDIFKIYYKYLLLSNACNQAFKTVLVKTLQIIFIKNTGISKSKLSYIMFYFLISAKSTTDLKLKMLRYSSIFYFTQLTNIIASFSK